MANNIVFRGYKASKIDFVNLCENGEKLEFETKYSYNVRYSKNNTCVGEFTVEVADKVNKDKFHINVIIQGVFSYNPEVQKEILHVQTYKELFPYARAVVSNLTVNAGIPPVIIPNSNIENQSIYRFGNN